MHRDARDKKKTSKRHAKSGEKKRPKEGRTLRSARELESYGGRGITPVEERQPLKRSYDDGDESHIVPLEPTQTYILRDFVATNNTLNKSMSILKEQNDFLVKQVEQTRVEEKAAVLREAANDVRQNAMALASVVQAKVAYIKAVNGKK